MQIKYGSSKPIRAGTKYLPKTLEPETPAEKNGRNR